MSQENARLVERFYELWNEGASLEPLLDPEFEWVSPPDAVEPGTLKGIADARAGVAKIREIFHEHRFEPERYVETGDDIVVIIGARARTERGIETDWRGGHVWTVRKGRIVRLLVFNDVQQAFDAVGLQE